MTSQDYEPQKTLQEILEELADYCAVNFAVDPKIVVILPKVAQRRFEQEMLSKTRSYIDPKHTPIRVKEIYPLSGGTVKIFDDEDYVVVKKA